MGIITWGFFEKIFSLKLQWHPMSILCVLITHFKWTHLYINYFRLKKSKRKREYVTRLYNSELCGDWLLKSPDSKDLLMEVCKSAVEEKDDGSYDHTPFDDDMGNLCKCHYPSDYYNSINSPESLISLRFIKK